MAKFLLVYTGGGMAETEADQAAVMAAWMSWFEKLGPAVVDAGNPFTPAAKTVTGNGRVSDGAVGTPATGYTIISADSLDAAAALCDGSPVLQNGQITVYEIFPVM